MRARFQFTCDPPVAQLQISGELDLSTGGELADVLLSVGALTCTHVELDAEDVAFVDAYSLAMLRREQRRLRAAGGDLEVVAAAPCFVLVARLAEYATLLPTGGRVLASTAP